MDYKEIKKRLDEIGHGAFGVKKEIKYLPEVLRSNEKIYSVASGFFDKNTWLIVLTDMRIIFLDKGLIYGLKQLDIRLDKINSVQSSSGMMLGKIAIWDGSGKMEISNVPKKLVKVFVDATNERLEALSEPREAKSFGDDDMIARLEKLAKLKESGVLSEEEFQTQKTKILNG